MTTIQMHDACIHVSHGNETEGKVRRKTGVTEVAWQTETGSWFQAVGASKTRKHVEFSNQVLECCSSDFALISSQDNLSAHKA